MLSRLELGDVSIDVEIKDIKNLHLSVHPPTGRVRISAPSHMSRDAIRVFAISKLGWIKRQQQGLQEQEREEPREYLDRESHWVWGKRYLLDIREAEEPPRVELSPSKMTLTARPNTDQRRMKEVVDGWYRDLLRDAIPPLLERWEPVLDVKVKKFFLQRMKTRWGSCNRESRTIRLNTELAKKPPECLEYIVVHELAHLVEPTHSARFVALMDEVMPRWRLSKESLNRLPVPHGEWMY